MSYPRVVSRNGLTGSYAGTPGDKDAEWKRMIAGDMRRLEQDSTDDHHVEKFVVASGAEPGQVRKMLTAFFTDFGYAGTPGWLGTDPHGRDRRLQAALDAVLTPEAQVLWSAHADRRGWQLDVKIRKLEAMADGVFE